jgi:hypothetical protein
MSSPPRKITVLSYRPSNSSGRGIDATVGETYSFGSCSLIVPELSYVLYGAPMPGLILELATDHGNHYEVLDEARNVVGHIMLSDAAPPEMPWIWGISSGHHAGRKPTYGYEATCEAAMEAFARVWHRE